jgi:hypothetical protein
MTGAAAGVVASKAAAGAAFGAGFVLGGGAVGLLVALHVFEVRPTPAPPIARAPEVVAVAPEAPAASVPSVDVPAATAPAPVAATPLHSGAPAPATSIDPEEARILGRAQSALTRGNRDAARAALDEHARRFPRGALAAERDRLRAGLDAATTGQPDAGRAPHRLMGTDD